MVHHSMLSIPLNFGLLHPSEVVTAILARDLPIASKEALIRQIIGWREYMRQFYISYRHDLYLQNALEQREKIPAYWWDYSGSHHGEKMTTMNCVDTVLARVQDENYSHHIERLMVIGNYALLMGYHPLEVNRWFAEMYIDAFEWVVSPNVLAMSQYSDGGRLASKPYISWGNYIEKMSDYCRWCRYSVREKTCPMTALYWDFVDRNTSLFESGRNPYILSNLRKIDIEKVRALKTNFTSLAS
jgi:deoxyribodipyrimidine photolyase-related protein